MLGTKVILFNGPKLCGKDTAINYLKYLYPEDKIAKRECKDHLHKLTQLFFDVPSELYWELYTNRETKEQPREEFNMEIEIGEYYDFIEMVGSVEGSKASCCSFKCSLSIRQAMIYVSELVCKPRFGQDYFGKARANSITDDLNVVVDGSCGFVEEIPPLLDVVDKDNILLVRVHREGYGFDGDSRGYIEDKEVPFKTVDVYNNGTEEEFLKEINTVYNDFVKPESVKVMKDVYMYRFGGPGPDTTLLLQIGDDRYWDLYFNIEVELTLDEGCKIYKPSKWAEHEVKKVEEYYESNS